MYLCKAQSMCRLSLVQIGPYLPGLQHNVMYQLRPQSNPKSVTLSLNHWKSNRIELVWKTIHSNCAKLPIYLDSGPGQFCLAINSTKKYPTTCYSRKSGTGTSKTIGTTYKLQAHQNSEPRGWVTMTFISFSVSVCCHEKIR